MHSSFTEHTQRSANAFRFGLRAGNFRGLTSPAWITSRQHRTELAVAIVQQERLCARKPSILHRYVSCLLLDPLLVRIRCDPGQADAPRLRLDEEKHVTKPLRVKTSRVNKSVPASTSMWARIKSRQRVVCLRLGAGAMPWHLRTLPTVWSETLCPRLASAPTMRS